MNNTTPQRLSRALALDMVAACRYQLHVRPDNRLHWINSKRVGITVRRQAEPWQVMITAAWLCRKLAKVIAADATVLLDYYRHHLFRGVGGTAELPKAVTREIAEAMGHIVGMAATLPVSQKSAQEWQLEHPDASQFTPVVAAAEAMAHLVCLHDDPERLLDAVETELLLAVLTTGDEEVLAV